MKDLLRNKTPSKFVQIWTKEVEKHGYTQVPNIILRNNDYFQLGVNEKLVLLLVLSVGEGFASASLIAEWSSLSVFTVRKCIRSLDNDKQIIYRIKDQGSANKFSTYRLTAKAIEVAKKLDRDKRMIHSGIGVSESNPIVNNNTNKEAKSIKNKENYGLNFAREQAEKIKNKAKEV
jgi:hypothetical protein